MRFAIAPLEEHRRIIEREPNAKTRAFYEMCWHLGGPQSDVAHLKAEDIDWSVGTLSYGRIKTGTISILRLGPQLEELLRRLPQSGFLFPTLARMHEKHRAKQFRRSGHPRLPLRHLRSAGSQVRQRYPRPRHRPSHSPRA